MKNFLLLSFVLLSGALGAYAQKGVDQQSRKIHEDAVKGTQITSNNNNRSFDFGEGKTKTRTLLQNPFRLPGRRDVLIQSVLSVMKDRKLILDENASRPADGFLVTEPFVFAKGAVITQNELSKYALVPQSDAVFTRARYILTIEVQSIDGAQNDVFVTAKIDGKSEGGGLGAEWTTLQSSGIAEDEFLAKLVETVTGVAPTPIVVQ